MLMLVLTVQFVKPKVQGSRGGSKNGPTSPGSALGQLKDLQDCIGQVICGYLRLMFVLGCGHIWPIPMLTSRYKKRSGKQYSHFQNFPSLLLLFKQRCCQALQMSLKATCSFRNILQGWLRWQFFSERLTHCSIRPNEQEQCDILSAKERLCVLLCTSKCSLHFKM